MAAQSPSQDLITRLTKVYALVSTAGKWTPDNENNQKKNLMHHSAPLKESFLEEKHLGAIFRWLKFHASSFQKDPSSIPSDLFALDHNYSNVPPLLAATGYKAKNTEADKQVTGITVKPEKGTGKDAKGSSTESKDGKGSSKDGKGTSKDAKGASKDGKGSSKDAKGTSKGGKGTSKGGKGTSKGGKDDGQEEKMEAQGSKKQEGGSTKKQRKSDKGKDKDDGVVGENKRPSSPPAETSTLSTTSKASTSRKRGREDEDRNDSDNANLSRPQSPMDVDPKPTLTMTSQQDDLTSSAEANDEDVDIVPPLDPLPKLAVPSNDLSADVAKLVVSHKRQTELLNEAVTNYRALVEFHDATKDLNKQLRERLQVTQGDYDDIRGRIRNVEDAKDWAKDCIKKLQEENKALRGQVDALQQLREENKTMRDQLELIGKRLGSMDQLESNLNSLSQRFNAVMNVSQTPSVPTAPQTDLPHAQNVAHPAHNTQNPAQHAHNPYNHPSEQFNHGVRTNVSHAHNAMEQGQNTSFNPQSTALNQNNTGNGQVYHNNFNLSNMPILPPHPANFNNEENEVFDFDEFINEHPGSVIASSPGSSSCFASATPPQIAQDHPPNA
ncbi:hypothetical protein CC2G_015205 [Coprinopsis cinerea AmutBmut pab1-1]|nr:hypothetical protein CC2G_015205 [Coprinopsis cinerea AmutBmut pab1-1]